MLQRTDRVSRAIAILAMLASFAGCQAGTTHGGRSTDATLRALTFSAGTLDPAFASGTFSYAVTVPSGTARVTVTPTASDTSAASLVVSQDGVVVGTVASGTASPILTLPASGSPTTIAVAVTAADGATTQTYRIVVGQASTSDASLGALRASTGTLGPAFASGTTAYTLTAPQGTSTLTLTPTASNAHVQSIAITQDGASKGTVASGGTSAALAVPAAGATSTVRITVTAQDGSTTRTYTFTLRQTDSSDASLARLTTSGGALSPSFASGTLAYAVAVPFGTASVTMTPTASNALVASIAVKQDGATVNDNLASGAASGALTVPALGSTSTITILVTAQDRSTTRTYTVTLTRSRNADASLTSLVASAGTLAPTFAAGTTSYALQVPSGASTVTITPTAHDANVTSIAVSRDGAGVGTVASGAASPAIAVPAPGGSAVVTVVVTAQDGVATTTYTLHLTQASSTDATLSGIALSAGGLAPTFASGTSDYAVRVPSGTASVTVTPTATASSVRSIAISQDGGAATSVASGAASPAYAVPAVGTTSTLSILVTAQDGTTTRTYTIALSQATADASLAALADSAGGLTGFSPATLSYAFDLPYQAGAYSVTATTNDAQATLQINGAAATSGTPTLVALSPGSNTVTVHVVARDGVSAQDYVLTITEAAAPPVAGLVNARTVPVTPSALPTLDPGLTMPAAGATAVPADTLLRIGFDAPPTLGTTGKIQIFKSDGTLVDVINLADGPKYGAMSAAAAGISTTAPYLNTMVNIIGGGQGAQNQVRFAWYTPVVITGSTVTIFPHQSRLSYSTPGVAGGTYSLAQTLAYGASYYVNIDPGVIQGAAINGVPFNGITDATTWTFSTKASAPTGAVSGNHVTYEVSWDNGKDFATVQGAINASTNTAYYYVLKIAPGVYQELLFARNQKYLTFKGTSGNNGLDTVIQYDNCDSFNNGVGGGTGVTALGSPSGGGRPVFLISGGDQILFDGITLKSTHAQGGTVLPTVPTATTLASANTQAEVLYYNNKYAMAAKHSNFVGYQDTLQLTGVTWFYDSFITGDVDFIWGYPNVALFERSEIKSRLRTGAEPSIVQSRTYPGTGTYAGSYYGGFVFLNCALTKEDGTFKAYLARSNGPSSANFDVVAYINSTFDVHVDPTGWNVAAASGGNVGANLAPTPVAGWRQYGNFTPAGQPVDTSQYLASSAGVNGSVNLTSAARATFFPDRATILSGLLNGTADGVTYSMLGMNQITNMGWTTNHYSDFFSDTYAWPP